MEIRLTRYTSAILTGAIPVAEVEDTGIPVQGIRAIDGVRRLLVLTRDVHVATMMIDDRNHRRGEGLHVYSITKVTAKKLGTEIGIIDIAGTGFEHGPRYQRLYFSSREPHFRASWPAGYIVTSYILWLRWFGELHTL